MQTTLLPPPPALLRSACHCTSQKKQSHGSHSQASRCNLLKMICSLEREPLLLSFSFLFCLGVFTSHFHLQVQNYTAAVFLTNPTLPGKMSLFYLKCQCQNYLVVGKNRAKLKKTSLALFILEFRFFSLTSKKIISSKHSPIEEPDTVFPLYGTETGNHVSQVLGEKLYRMLYRSKMSVPFSSGNKTNSNKETN